MRLFRYAIATIVILVVGAAYVGWQWYSAGNVQLTQTVVAAATAYRPTPTQSVIPVSTVIPYAPLVDAANHVPVGAVDREGAGESCGRVDRERLCARFRWRAALERSGPVTIAASPRGIRLAAPLAIAFKGELRDDNGEALHLAAKHGRIPIDAWVDVTFGVGGDWCPVAAAEPGQQWREASKVEVVGRHAVNLEGLFEVPVREFLAKTAAALRGAAACDAMPKTAAQLWRPRSIPIDLPGASRIHLALAPVGLGWTAIAYGAQDARITLALSGRSEVSLQVPAAVPAAALPLAGPSAEGQGKLALLIPVALNYRPLDDAISRDLAASPIIGEATVDRVEMHVSGVQLFPAGERLALSVAFAAQLPSRWFPARGRLFATAAVRPMAEGRRLGLADIAYAPLADGALGRALGPLLDGPLKTRLSQLVLADLGETSDLAAAALREELKDPVRTGGLRIVVGDPKIELTGAVPQDAGLVATIRYNAAATAEVATDTRHTK
ncbi:MAG TPA: DUF4403 family protein [Stellaceae bacterium]|nr:DUF4403 family protein [Stellaceae bacterium]